jgi:signal transduction histidine kinase
MRAGSQRRIRVSSAQTVIWGGGQDDLPRGGVILEEDPPSSARTMPPARDRDTVVQVNRLRQLRRRVSAMDPLRVDTAIAALFAVAMVIEARYAQSNGESRVLTGAFGVAMVSSIAVRRERPELAALWLSGVIFLQGVVGNTFLFDETNAPFIAVLFMLYSTARHSGSRYLWPVIAAFYGALFVGVLTSVEGFSSEDIIWFGLLFGLPVVAGRALRSRVLLQRELREKAHRTEAERASRARRAIEEERDRIASELQAVVANGVSAMVIQAEAVPRLLAANDGASAELALAAVEETGRDALGEMRRLLGVLRREDEGLALSPQPGLARLQALVERQHEHGLEVDLRVEGDARPLSTGVDLTAYRVLEDALQAAVRQRAERATVLLRYRDEDLQLEVRDDRSGGASARFPGLRNRVGLYGGHLTVGREEGVGFTLRARLPMREGVR